MRSLLLVGLLLAAAAAVTASAPAAGAAAAPTGYADAVDQSLAILRGGGEERAVAARALAALQAGTGDSQPEVEADLVANPPRLQDARTRLLALSQSLRDPAFTPAPARADQTLRDILAQPRYAGIRPSPLDGLRDAVLRAVAGLLDRLLSGATGAPPWLRWVLDGGTALVLLTVAGLLVLAVRRRGRRGAVRGVEADLARRVRDRFADADRLAAAGDLAAAIRALAGGVAAALGDERDWDLSPLTVRELFARAPEPAALRPLLLAFERATYGGQTLDHLAYARAADAARPFRGRHQVAT
jgi:hypothetical protein